MKFKILIFTVFGFVLASTFGQTLSNTDKIIHPNDTLSEPGIRLSKDSDSLNGYLNDTIFSILDTALTSRYPFIHFEQNHYQFFTEESPTFERLFFEIQQMIHTGIGKVNIYHIGGSHIQADIYSNVMREHLLSYWNGLDGERGWVFPFRIAGTNNPKHYKFQSNNKWTGYRSVVTRPDSVEYGMSGMAISTRAPLANLSFSYSGEGHKPPFDHIRIYHNKGLLPYQIYFDNEKTAIKLQHTNQDLGYTDVYFQEEHRSFEVFFKKVEDSLFLDKVEEIIEIDETDKETAVTQTLFIYGIQLMNNRPGFSYTSIGVNGAGLYTYHDNENFLEQLSQTPPDFMIFSVGTNDANVPNGRFKPEEFEQNLEALINKVLIANPDCAILLTTPNDSYYRRRTLNRNLETVKDINIKLAEKYRIPVWDLYGLMGGLGSSKKWQQNRLMSPDLVHFTSDGYKLKGDIFFEAFLKWIDQMEQKPRKTLLKKN